MVVISSTVAPLGSTDNNDFIKAAERKDLLQDLGIVKAEKKDFQDVFLLNIFNVEASFENTAKIKMLFFCQLLLYLWN